MKKHLGILLLLSPFYTIFAVISSSTIFTHFLLLNSKDDDKLCPENLHFRAFFKSLIASSQSWNNVSTYEHPPSPHFSYWQMTSNFSIMRRFALFEKNKKKFSVFSNFSTSQVKTTSLEDIFAVARRAVDRVQEWAMIIHIKIKILRSKFD